MARDLVNIKFKRVALVDKGANFDKETQDGAHILLWKRHVVKDSPTLGQVHVDGPLHTEDPDCLCVKCDKREDWEKSIYSSSTRNSLPDSSFAAVWTDETDNKQRKLPYKNADGSLNHGHWSNALARINQTDMPAHVKTTAHSKLEAARPKENNVKKTFADVIKSLTKVFGETDEAKRTALLKQVEEDVEKADLIPGTPAHENAEAQHINALQALHKTMGAHVATNNLPPEHPLYKMHQAIGKAMTDAGCAPAQEDHGNMAKVDDVAKAAMTAVEKRLQETEELLKTERNLRLETELTTVLKSFKATSFNLDEKDTNNDIKKFRKMQQTDPEGYARMMQIFKAADEQLATSALFAKQFGSSRSGSAGSAEAQLQAKADSLIQKDGKLTKAAAFEQACLDNPGLVAEYRREQQ